MLKTVWIICKYGSPRKYGVSTKPYRTAKYLSENGICTFLVTSDSNHLAKYPKSDSRFNREIDAELNHIWIRTLKYTNSASIKRILSWFAFEWHLFRLDKRKMGKPDVIVISSLSLMTVLNGLHLKTRYGCKLVFEIRDIYPLTLTEELGVSPHNPIIWLLKIIEMIGYRKADLIVGTMPNLASHVKTVLGHEKEVFFSPLGINDSWYGKAWPSKRIDALFPNDNRVVIGYAGSMGRTNALDSFVNAIKLLEDDERLFFVLVGQGDQKEEYIERLRECKNVNIGPKIEQYEIPYFLSRCDILYLSTHDSKIWDYGQSMNKLVDYMMAGKPTIASYSGYPSMLNEADSGVFLKTKSSESIIAAIREFVYMDAERRQEIGKRGAKWIRENCDNSVVCGEYLDKLRELVGNEDGLSTDGRTEIIRYMHS